MEHKIHIAYYDFWKGIAILMVVAIHTGWGFDFVSMEGNLRIVLRSVMNSAVPIFLAISGYFLSKQLLDNREKVLAFWKKQISKVYIPMLFWSIPYILIGVLLHKENLLKSFILMICGGYSIYYFIPLIIQCYVLLPFIQKYKTFSFYGSVVLCIFSWLFISYVLPPLPLIVYAGSFMPWIYFFVLGIIMANRGKKNLVFFSIMLLIVGIALQYLESLYLFSLGHISWGQKATSIVSNTGIILFLFSDRVRTCYNSNKMNRIIEFFGIHSFGIYLVYCYFIFLLSFFNKINSWSIKCFIVISLTSLFVVIIRYIIPKNICVKYLGFR